MPEAKPRKLNTPLILAFLASIALYAAMIILDVVCFRGIMPIAVPLAALGVMILDYVLYFLGSMEISRRGMLILNGILAAISLALFLIMMPRYSAAAAEKILQAENLQVTDQGEYKTMITDQDVGFFIEEGYFFYCTSIVSGENVMILFNPKSGGWDIVGSW